MQHGVPPPIPSGGGGALRCADVLCAGRAVAPPSGGTGSSNWS